MTNWANLDYDTVRRAWIAQFGGAYPNEMIEAYLNFVESMAGTSTFALELLQKAYSEHATGGISDETAREIDVLLSRDYMTLRQRIKQAFQSLFEGQ